MPLWRAAPYQREVFPGHSVPKGEFRAHHRINRKDQEGRKTLQVSEVWREDPKTGYIRVGSENPDAQEASRLPRAPRRRGPSENKHEHCWNSTGEDQIDERIVSVPRIPGSAVDQD